MRKPYKIMLGIVVGFMCLGAILRVTGVTADTSNAQDASTDQPSDQSVHSGWATSTAAFVQRWNSEVQDVYRISDLQSDGNGGGKATLLGAKITGLDNKMYALYTHNEEKFGPMCVATVRAALDVSADEAQALVSQVHSNMQNSTIPGYGLVEYNGYNISMQQSAVGGELGCTVMPKGE